MDGFTLTNIAFPVAPANLAGFTIQAFAWTEVEAVITIPAINCFTLDFDDVRTLTLDYDYVHSFMVDDGDACH